MTLRRLHRRLTVIMAVSGLVAFAGSAGVEPLSAALASVGLVVALIWLPSPETAKTIERLFLPLAVLLAARALFHVLVVGGDIVVPVVDLLLLLLVAETLRAPEAHNDVRLYALSFALLLASTAYRPGVIFALAFVAYVILATVALMVGHLSRQAHNHRLRDISVQRPFMMATVGLSGVTLAMSAVVFLTFPRFQRNWVGRGNTLATSIAGFADEVSLGTHGSRIVGNPQIVLRVEFPDGRPTDLNGLHWRGRSYDRFDGVRWSRSRRLPPSLAPTSWYVDRWGGAGYLAQKIYGAPLDVRVLFALHPVVDIEPHSSIQPIFDNAGDFVYWGRVSPSYTAISPRRRPAPDSLRTSARGYTPSRRHFLQLPELPERMQALADSLTAGLDNRYDRVRAIESWFHNEFAYTLDLPATAREATLEYFLFQRRAGHCEYFSTAMVMLLRMEGIPAREVNGFLGGEWSDFGQYLAVTQNQAHAWVEVWFPDFGWVPFDPTPGGGSGEALATAWFWPGRFLLDGLQHRWSKWVLDYNVESQWNFFRRLGDFFSREEEVLEGTSGSVSNRDWSPLWLTLLIFAGLSGAVLFARNRTAYPAETRIYLGLREACRRAWKVRARSLTPASILDKLRREGSGAAPHAAELIRLYQETRFGGRELTPERRKVMASSLSLARRGLNGPG
jgi:transglutaminase-like putative cysteine protease